MSESNGKKLTNQTKIDEAIKDRAIALQLKLQDLITDAAEASIQVSIELFPMETMGDLVPIQLVKLNLGRKIL